MEELEIAAMPGKPTAIFPPTFNVFISKMLAEGFGISLREKSQSHAIEVELTLAKHDGGIDRHRVYYKFYASLFPPSRFHIELQAHLYELALELARETSASMMERMRKWSL